MSGQQSWQCQGRQQHGWFGNGTCPSNTEVGGDDGRYQRIVFGVIGDLPPALRSRWDGMLSRGLAGRAADVLGRLSEASGFSPSRFGELLPDTVGSIAAGRIQAAARAAASAHTPDDERPVSAALADAVEAVGLDNWSRFVAGVEAQTAADSGGGIIRVQEPILSGQFPYELFSRPPEFVAPKPPLKQFPTDPAKPPGPGWVWQGRPGSTPGGKEGNWVKPETGESLRPNMDHPPPIRPHWDYREPGKGQWWRWFPDGSVEPKA